jgi:predicted transcriptional regulator
MPKRKEEMTKTSFRLTWAEKNALDKYAEEHDLSVSQVIRRAIRYYLTHSDREE